MHKKCNMNVIESEYHFLLVCLFYRNIRSKFLPKYYCKWPSIHKFNTLLTSSNNCMNIKLAKYIYMNVLKQGNKYCIYVTRFVLYPQLLNSDDSGWGSY